MVQALEARSLITQQNIIVKGADGVSRISTNILHLPRFKLNVVPGLIKVRHSNCEAGSITSRVAGGFAASCCGYVKSPCLVPAWLSAGFLYEIASLQLQRHT